VLNEFEECAWRFSGQFDKKDINNIKSMLSIKRNKDYVDKAFFDTDMQSLDKFIGETNNYDNRV
jgi:hypothetical protein